MVAEGKRGVKGGGAKIMISFLLVLCLDASQLGSQFFFFILGPL